MANTKAPGSKGDTVIKLVLVFFISLLSFSIGTFIGKKFSDNQHQLADLEPGSKGARDIASVPASEVKPETALKEEDIAKLAEEFVTDEEDEGQGVKHDAGHSHSTEAKAEKTEGHGMAANEHEKAKSEHGSVTKGSHEAEHTPSEKTNSNEHEPQKAAKRMAEGKWPSEETAKAQHSRIPNSLPAAVAQSSIGKYTVQIASYPQEEDAKKMAEDLRKKGFAANYVQAFAKGQNWYRVVVGLFSTAEEAQKYRNDLLAKASVTSAIVQKISR